MPDIMKEHKSLDTNLKIYVANFLIFLNLDFSNLEIWYFTQCVYAQFYIVLCSFITYANWVSVEKLFRNLRYINDIYPYFIQLLNTGKNYVYTIRLFFYSNAGHGIWPSIVLKCLSLIYSDNPNDRLPNLISLTRNLKSRKEINAFFSHPWYGKCVFLLPFIIFSIYLKQNFQKTNCCQEVISLTLISSYLYFKLIPF